MRTLVWAVWHISWPNIHTTIGLLHWGNKDWVGLLRFVCVFLCLNTFHLLGNRQVNCMHHGIKKRQHREKNHKIKKIILWFSSLFYLFSRMQLNVKNKNPPAIKSQNYKESTGNLPLMYHSQFRKTFHKSMKIKMTHHQWLWPHSPHFSGLLKPLW